MVVKPLAENLVVRPLRRVGEDAASRADADRGAGDRSREQTSSKYAGARGGVPRRP